MHYRDGRTRSFEMDDNWDDFPDKKDITAIDVKISGKTHTLKGSKSNECLFFMHKVGYSQVGLEGGEVNEPLEEIEVGFVEGEHAVVMNVSLKTGSLSVYSTTTESLGLDLEKYGYEAGPDEG